MSALSANPTDGLSGPIAAATPPGAHEFRRFDLWGAPYDSASTLGWPGSREAPARVREALSWITQRIENGRIYSLERDEILDVGADLLTDRGDVDVVGHDLHTTLAAVSAAVSDTVRAGRVPIVVGGDDCLLFPTARGLHDAVSGSVAVVHFDAHLDLMDSNTFQGSHSQSSGMRRSLELARIDPRHCVQVGVRHFNFPSSYEFKRASGLRHISAERFLDMGVAGVVEQVLAIAGQADHLFLSFDIDVIDPGFAPGAGAYEPGGITSAQALQAVRLLAPHSAALALTEVNPMTDHRTMTATLAAYLLFHFAVAGSGGAA